MNNSNSRPTRESRSVRLDQDEWDLAEAIAVTLGARSAGAGIREALEMALNTLSREGVAESLEGAMCPRGGHPFVWNQQRYSQTSEPGVGELVLCSGTEEFFCGYQFVWRGGQRVREVRDSIRSARKAGDR